MFFALFFLVSPTLKPGDDPYKILGVPRTATEKEIKDAFHKKTRLYHPDLNKDPGAEKMWIRCNDAYELLKDSRRRNIYDRTGSVAEDGNYYDSPQQGADADFFFNDFFFGRSKMVVNTEFLSSFKELKNKLNENPHCFVYFSLNKDSSDYAFETAASVLSHEMPFYRLSSLHSEVCHYLVNNSPIKADYYSAYLRLLPSGKIRITPFGNTESSDKYSNYISQLKECYPMFKKLRKLKSFVSKSKSKPLIVILDMEPTFTADIFRKMVTVDHIYDFALMHGDYLETVKYFKLKNFPSYILFKNGKFVADYNSLDDLLESKESINVPELKPDITPSFFVLYYGDPSTIPQDKIRDFSALPIFWTKQSFSNRGMKLKENQFCFVSLKSKKHHVIPQEMTLSEGYVDFKKNHKKYSNGIPFDYNSQNFSLYPLKRNSWNLFDVHFTIK